MVKPNPISLDDNNILTVVIFPFLYSLSEPNINMVPAIKDIIPSLKIILITSYKNNKTLRHKNKDEG